MTVGEATHHSFDGGEPPSGTGAAAQSAPLPGSSGRRGRSLISLLRRGFFLLFAMTLLVGASGVGSVLVVTGRIDRLTQTLAPLASTNSSLLRALLNAETGERGYLLTRRRAFLLPYRQGLTAYPVAAATATRLAMSEPAGRRLLHLELTAGTRWIDQYAEPALHAAGANATGSNADVATSQSPLASLAEGKRLLNEFRTANTALQRWLDRQIVLADANSHRTEWLVLSTIAAITALAISLGSAAARQVHQSVVPPLRDLLSVLERQRHGETDLRAEPTGAREVQAVAHEVNRLTAILESAAQAREYRDKLRAIATELGHRLGRRLAMGDLLGEAAWHIGPALDVDLTWILLDDDSGSNHQWRSSTTPPMAIEPSVVLSAMQEFIDVAGPRSHWVDLDPAAQTEEAPCLPTLLRAEAWRTGLRALVICPLHAGRAQLGVLVLGRCGGPLSWEESDVDLIETISGDLVRAALNAQLYEKQLTLVEELQALDRQKDEFVATVSHELRSPLTSVQGYLELLRDGDAGPLLQDQETMVETIQRNAARLAVLIEDLLTLSRLKSNAAEMRREPVQLRALLEAVVDTVRPQADKKHLDLVSVTDGADAWITGDADALEQVLLNLAANAVKFTPENGRVSVTQACDAGSVAVKVSDSGIGIPSREQARLFGQFFRASNATAAAIPGTGLGLHIVSRIVEQHGGTISVKSEADRGATFIVTFPLVDSAS